MIIEIYMIGCLIAFFLGWMQASEEQRRGHDISQFGAAMVVITMLSWVYVAYWICWYNSGGGSRVC